MSNIISGFLASFGAIGMFISGAFGINQTTTITHNQDTALSTAVQLTHEQFASFPESLMSREEALQNMPSRLPYDITDLHFGADPIMDSIYKYPNMDTNLPTYGTFGYEDMFADKSIDDINISKDLPTDFRKRFDVFSVINDNNSTSDTHYFLQQLQKGCTGKADLGIGDGPSCIITDPSTIDTRYVMSPTNAFDGAESMPHDSLIFRVGDFFLGVNSCGYFDYSSADSKYVPQFCSQDQLVSTAQLYACRFYNFMYHASTSSMVSQSLTSHECATGISPPSNLSAQFIQKDDGDDHAGTVKLTWQNNGDYSSIQIERALDINDPNTGGFKLIDSIQPLETYADDINSLKLVSPKEEYRIRGVNYDGTYTEYSNVAEMSNCIPIDVSGDRKIVFNRSDNSVVALPKITDYLDYMNKTIATFGTIDPYKSYRSHFSFYTDLNRLTFSGSNIPQSQYSCQGNVAGTFFQPVADDIDSVFVFIDSSESRTHLAGATVSGLNTANIYLPNPQIREMVNGHYESQVDYYLVPVHEIGHALGMLQDEYKCNNISGQSNPRLGTVMENENCALNPGVEFADSSDGTLYGSTTIKAVTSRYTTDPMYIPSAKSLMNLLSLQNSIILPDGTFTRIADQRLNVVSCGYLLSAIMRQPTDKAHAEKYWPDCAKMDTVKD